MRHPFESIPVEKRPAAFWGLLAATLVVALLMNLIGAPLITAAAPGGIVTYELAGSVAAIQAILDSWDANAQLHAALSLGFDYVFMLVYGAALSLACLMAATQLRLAGWSLAGLGVPLAWGAWLAAALDAVENLALILLLFGPVADPWPAVARWCAIAKFLLILGCLLYAMFGLAAHLFRRLSVREA